MTLGAPPRMTSTQEHLWRQVSPGWIDPGQRATSQTFTLYPKDAGLVSTARQSHPLTPTPDAAHAVYVSSIGESIGVVTLTVGDIDSAPTSITPASPSAALQALADGGYPDGNGGVLPAWHASIDCTAYAAASKAEQRALRAVLMHLARGHGVQYVAPGKHFSM